MQIIASCNESEIEFRRIDDKHNDKPCDGAVNYLGNIQSDSTPTSDAPGLCPATDLDTILANTPAMVNPLQHATHSRSAGEDMIAAPGDARQDKNSYPPIVVPPSSDDPSSNNRATNDMQYASDRISRTLEKAAASTAGNGLLASIGNPTKIELPGRIVPGGHLGVHAPCAGNQVRGTGGVVVADDSQGRQDLNSIQLRPGEIAGPVPGGGRDDSRIAV